MTRPYVGLAVGAALMFAAAATLILGIAPGEILHAADNGAHTLQAPQPPASAVTAVPQQEQ
jgi:hypothetical protein